MIKMKKSAALILAGVLACSMPMPVMASSDTEVVESLLDSGIDFLASDPGKAVDIIMYAKDLVDQQNITDDQVRSAVTQAADHFGRHTVPGKIRLHRLCITIHPVCIISIKINHYLRKNRIIHIRAVIRSLTIQQERTSCHAENKNKQENHCSA